MKRPSPRVYDPDELFWKGFLIGWCLFIAGWGVYLILHSEGIV